MARHAASWSSLCEVEPAEDVGWGDEGLVGDGLDEGGGDRVGADPCVDRELTSYWWVGAQHGALEPGRDVVAGDERETEAGECAGDGGGALVGADLPRG